jgi:hypothetical protein
MSIAKELILVTFITSTSSIYSSALHVLIFQLNSSCSFWIVIVAICLHCSLVKLHLFLSSEAWNGMKTKLELQQDVGRGVEEAGAGH